MSWTSDLRGAARLHRVEAKAPELVRFVELFVRWNVRINLSAARTPEDVTLQVVDCLSLVPYMYGVGALVDVGSGGGLPGLVLATALPELRVRSIEPVHKKAAFQSTACRELALALVTVESRRVGSGPGQRVRCRRLARHLRPARLATHGCPTGETGRRGVRNGGQGAAGLARSAPSACPTTTATGRARSSVTGPDVPRGTGRSWDRPPPVRPRPVPRSGRGSQPGSIPPAPDLRLDRDRHPDQATAGGANRLG